MGALFMTKGLSLNYTIIQGLSPYGGCVFVTIDQRSVPLWGCLALTVGLSLYCGGPKVGEDGG